ncbi:RNA polymerase sigma factor [Cytobacillus sp. IB215316]|uniref:RNA polymerase sigma factor n=1 Tax=Cytobacillus sp. IB215316 TaxID=3097354 RepID=UPI002A129F91|nr:RNA polymerase sigma factor [Cytobacillus sp. IB215316]MDX8363173.1 RNA polymerase sigma factor [Cytobacillus sp. IB215316]
MVFDNLALTITKLYKYCLKLTGSTWVAEDLVQETLLKVYRLRDSEPNREITYPFLYTVAKNLFIDEKRKKRDLFYFNEEIHNQTNDFLEYDNLIESLLVSLPLKQAMLLTLKDVFGYTIKELSSMLRTSNESIKTALHRSRKRLKSSPKSNADVNVQNHQIIVGLSSAIKEANANKIFFYYRLLEARNFKVRRNSSQSVCHVVDPDGNILEFLSSS